MVGVLGVAACGSSSRPSGQSNSAIGGGNQSVNLTTPSTQPMPSTVKGMDWTDQNGYQWSISRSAFNEVSTLNVVSSITNPQLDAPPGSTYVETQLTITNKTSNPEPRYNPYAISADFPALFGFPTANVAALGSGDTFNPDYQTIGGSSPACLNSNGSPIYYPDVLSTNDGTTFCELGPASMANATPSEQFSVSNPQIGPEQSQTISLYFGPMSNAPAGDFALVVSPGLSGHYEVVPGP